jgi:hypothetical protein
MAHRLIFVLAAVAVAMLWLGLRQQLNAPDPTRLPRPGEMRTTIRFYYPQACDAVISTTFLGVSKAGWEFHLVRCRDGGRFVYMQSYTLKKVGAKSCADEAAQGYRCPD